MTKEQAQKVIDYINQNMDFAVNDYIDLEDMQNFNNADSIEQELSDNGVFEQEAEVIYYANAMEYLLEHDPSLQLSLGIAHDFGYTTDKLNSELLATLLKAQNIREEFSDLKPEIDNIINTD